MSLSLKKLKNNLACVALFAVLNFPVIQHSFGVSSVLKGGDQQSEPHALIVVGLQFGDESKGSITDLLADSADG
ncbi:MAG: hypothetical protein ACRC4G_06435, partial [Alphaproteobacteria bacterium]